MMKSRFFLLSNILAGNANQELAYTKGKHQPKERFRMIHLIK